MEADSIFISDLQAGALAVDEYGRTYGDALELVMCWRKHM